MWTGDRVVTSSATVANAAVTVANAAVTVANAAVTAANAAATANSEDVEKQKKEDQDSSPFRKYSFR